MFEYLYSALLATSSTSKVCFWPRRHAWMTGAVGGAEVMYNPIQKCNKFTQRYIHDQYQNILKQKYSKCMSCRTALNEAGQQVLTTSLKFILCLLTASRVNVTSLTTQWVPGPLTWVQNLYKARGTHLNSWASQAKKEFRGEMLCEGWNCQRICGKGSLSVVCIQRA